jgi:hypothetical protein
VSLTHSSRREVWCLPVVLTGVVGAIIRAPGQTPRWTEEEVVGWAVIPPDGVESHEHVGSYGAYVAYATIQPSRDIAVGVFTNIGGGQDLRGAVARDAMRIATQVATAGKSD